MKRSFVVKVVGWCRCEGSLVVVENFSAIFGHFPPFLFIHEWTRMFTNVLDSDFRRNDGEHLLGGFFRSKFPPAREGRWG